MIKSEYNPKNRLFLSSYRNKIPMIYWELWESTKRARAARSRPFPSRPPPPRPVPRGRLPGRPLPGAGPGQHARGARPALGPGPLPARGGPPGALDGGGPRPGDLQRAALRRAGGAAGRLAPGPRDGRGLPPGGRRAARPRVPPACRALPPRGRAEGAVRGLRPGPVRGEGAGRGAAGRPVRRGPAAGRGGRPAARGLAAGRVQAARAGEGEQAAGGVPRAPRGRRPGRVGPGAGRSGRRSDSASRSAPAPASAPPPSGRRASWPAGTAGAPSASGSSASRSACARAGTSSGLPAPRLRRFAAAKRPSSIRRVFSGGRSNPHPASLAVRSLRKRSAAPRRWHPSTKSSAQRTRIPSPRALPSASLRGPTPPARRAASRSPRLRLVDRRQDLVDHRFLDDLALPCRDAQRSLAPVRLRNAHPLRRMRPVRSCRHAAVPVRQMPVQRLPVRLTRHPIHARGRQRNAVDGATPQRSGALRTDSQASGVPVSALTVRRQALQAQPVRAARSRPGRPPRPPAPGRPAAAVRAEPPSVVHPSQPLR